MDIAEGALNKLMEMYKELLPAMGGYLTHAGELDRRRLEMLMARVGQMELQVLEERAQVRQHTGYPLVTWVGAHCFSVGHSATQELYEPGHETLCADVHLAEVCSLTVCA